MLGHPVSIFIRSHVLVCPQLKCVLAFAVIASQGEDFVGAQRFREEDSEVA